MNPRWCKTIHHCPKCGREMKLGDLFYAADGQLQLIYTCPKDEVVFVWEPFASQLQEWARIRDLQRFFDEQKDKRPRPGRAI